MLNYFEPAAQAPDTQMPKLSEQGPKEFLLNIAKRVSDEVESVESRTRLQTIVKMCRRHRGSTPSDLFGTWKNSIWAESPRFGELHGTNIFQSLVRGAEANYYEAQIKLDISSNAGNFQNRATERISRGIYEILNGKHWQPPVEQELFYASILKNNAYIISRFNKAKAAVQLQKPQFSPVGYEQSGMAVCPDCYTSSSYSSGGQDQGCPQCGGQDLSVMNQPTKVQDYNVSGFTDIPAGETETIIADGLDISVDDRHGKPANIESCGWVEWRYPAQKSDLQRMYKLKLESKPKWSYPMRLKMAFKRYQAGDTGPVTEFDKQTYEVRQIWLDLAEYQDYVAPSDWTCGDMTIRQGQRFADIYTNGMVYGVVDQEIPFTDGEDKNRRVKACLWLADPESHYGLGAQAGLSLQRKINILDNMAMEGEARSMKGSIAYVPEAIDGAHLEGNNTNVPLRPDFATDGNPIKNFLMPIEVSGLSQSSLVYLESQMSVMQRVMGVPDVTLGEGDPSSRTAQGQALIDRNATGLIIPAKLSEGAARAGWLWDQLDLIQKFYPAEAVKQFGARYGEEWLDDEVQAFLSANLGKAVTIKAVAGSEVPESRFDKQQKLRGDIANGFIEITPEIRAKLARESGYDGIDPEFYDSNEKLAEKRYNWIKETLMPKMQQLEPAYDTLEGQLTDPKTGMRAEDGMGNKTPNPVIQQILTAPQMQISKQAENHEQQYIYWSTKCRELMGSAIEQPQVLIGVCEAMMTVHNMALFEAATKKATLGGLTNAPIAGHDAMSQAQASAPPPEPPPPTTQDKVLETVNYKDLPPEAQQMLAEKEGMRLPLSAFKAVHAANIKPAVSAPVAKKPAAKATGK